MFSDAPVRFSPLQLSLQVHSAVMEECFRKQSYFPSLPKDLSETPLVAKYAPRQTVTLLAPFKLNTDQKTKHKNVSGKVLRILVMVVSTRVLGELLFNPQHVGHHTFSGHLLRSHTLNRRVPNKRCLYLAHANYNC